MRTTESNSNITKVICDNCGNLIEKGKDNEIHDDRYYNRRLWGLEDEWKHTPTVEINNTVYEASLMNKLMMRERGLHFCDKSCRDKYFLRLANKSLRNL